MTEDQGRVRSSSVMAVTLLEVIAALVIAGTLMATLMGTLSITVRGITQAREAAHNERIASGIESILRRDMESGYGVYEKDLQTLIGRPDDGGGQPILEFFSTNSMLPEAQRSATGVARVEYLLRPSERLPGTWELLRRETPYTTGKPLNRSKYEAERLADGLVNWRLALFNGTEWKDAWQQNSLPLAVRTGFTLGTAEKSASYDLFFSPMVTSGVNPAPFEKR